MLCTNNSNKSHIIHSTQNEMPKAFLQELLRKKKKKTSIIDNISLFGLVQAILSNEINQEKLIKVI